MAEQTTFRGIHEHRCVHCGKTPSEAGIAKCEPIPQEPPTNPDDAPIGWAQVVILRLGLSLSASETSLLEKAFSESRAEERERCAAIARSWKCDTLLDNEGNMGDLADAIEEPAGAK